VFFLDSATFGCGVVGTQPKLPARPIERRLDGVSPKHVTSSIKEADMLQRRRTLALLQEELRTLALFDRVHDYTADPDPADDRAYALRQIRRSQIMAEIRKLSPSKLGYRNHARIGSAVLLLCTVGYATLHYLLK
jgi:hypothetical protein